MKPTPLLITLDVERDYGPDWATPDSLTFCSITDALVTRLAPIFEKHGIRPTYYLSPEVLLDRPSMEVLRGQTNAELAAHLHGEYLPPQSTEFAWTDPALRILDMQCEYPQELERAKLETLTSLFRQVCGRSPRSFRAGRFGLGPHTPALLRALGYWTDSSHTPHLRWESPLGSFSPDYRDASVMPGHLETGDDGRLFEIPITILAPGEHERGQDPLWFRPSFGTTEDLVHVAQHVVLANQQCQGNPRPLVMMFHSQELIAGASPYCQDEIDVTRFLERIDRCLTVCMRLGCEPMTAEELRLHYAQDEADTAFALTPASLQENQQVRLDEASFHESLDRNGVQGWFKYIHRERSTRSDLCVPFTWLAQELDRDAAILATGCGPGLNLHWLAERGFTDLSGLDCDEKALRTGIDLVESLDRKIRLWKDDGLKPRLLPDRLYDAVTALNWTSLVESFELGEFLRTWGPRIKPAGRLIVDCIDKAFDQHPKNAWLTWDWDKPEAERRPSEYRRRYSSAEVRCLAEAEGFEVEAVLTMEQEIPKKVFALRKRTTSDSILEPKGNSHLARSLGRDSRNPPVPRARILMVVDSPGWAHDNKSQALIGQLSDEFDLHKCYHKDLDPAALDAADLIVVWYWMQLAGSPEICAALERNRDKLVLGICSHAELEGEQGKKGVAVLRDYGRALFVHNRLLLAQWRGVFDKPLYLTPNGVDLGFYRPSTAPRSPGPLRVGWAGSLDNFGRDLRGFDLILQACAGIEDVEFVPAIKEERERSADEMLLWYQDIDVYVCASRCEGTPNTCLEAAACGLPLITTAVGNMPELLVDGVGGFFVERSVASIRAAIQAIAADPGLRARMSLANLATIQDWSWSRNAEPFRELFRDCLQSETTQV